MRLVPDVIFKSVTEVTPEFLSERGIKAIILDVDNTLTEHGSQKISADISDWLALMKEIGIKLMIVSNNNDKRIKPFADKIGVDYVAMGLKPMLRGYKRACKKFGVEKREILTVGDQIFTDVWGGNRMGMLTALVSPIAVEHGLLFKLKRRLEKPILKRLSQK